MSDITNAYEAFPSPTNTIILACRQIATTSPCDLEWKENTYWIWVDSYFLCKEHENLVQRAALKAHVSVSPIDDYTYSRRCDNTIHIAEMELTGTIEQGQLFIYTEMIKQVEETFPGVINQYTVYKAEGLQRAVIDNPGLEQAMMEDPEGWRQHTSDGSTKWDPITMTVIGESVAERIAMFWKDYIDIDMPQAITDDDPFPPLEMNSLAYSGKPAIAYFVCNSKDPKYQYDHCNGFQSNEPGHVMASIRVTKPDTVVVRDSHWAKESEPWNKDSLQADLMWLPTLFDKVLAFNIMLEEVIHARCDNLFKLTISVDKNTKHNNEMYSAEMDVFMRTIDTLACSKHDERSVRVTLFDWAKLTCPTIGNVDKHCPKVHGFSNILPDGQHPSGDSGLWLTRVTLAIIMAQISQNSLPKEFGTFSSWDEGFENPISKQLLELSPAEDVHMKDLVTSYYLCPYADYSSLERDFDKKQINFKNATSYRDSEHAIYTKD